MSKNNNPASFPTEENVIAQTFMAVIPHKMAFCETEL